jgi:hypothetical protein
MRSLVLPGNPTMRVAKFQEQNQQAVSVRILFQLPIEWLETRKVKKLRHIAGGYGAADSRR